MRVDAATLSLFFSLSQIDMTFYEHRILLLQAMSISLTEKQYTVAYIKKFFKKAFNAVINAACISTHYGPMFQLSY